MSSGRKKPWRKPWAGQREKTTESAPPGKRQHSQISQQILMKYILSVLAMIAGFILLFFLGWLICRLFIWESNDPLYRLLKAMEDTVLFWGGALILVGMFLLAYKSIAKPLGYLDEVITAAEQLAHPDETPIRLSKPMESIQDELNVVRERALRSAAYAREAEQRKNDWILYLAHDLKTPLTSVIGYLILLRDEPELSLEMRAKYTGIALEKAERLETLINEFFEITRLSLSQLTLQKESVNLTRMLEQVTFEFRPVLTEKHLRWKLSLAHDVLVSCDPDKLERAFDNLLRNAVNYSYDNTEILVRLTCDGEQALVDVENRGKTIPPEKLARIFEQFFRLDSARSSASGGAGLGLAIAKEIVELHGGSIQARSEAETISFRMVLPCQPDKSIEGKRSP